MVGQGPPGSATPPSDPTLLEKVAGAVGAPVLRAFVFLYFPPTHSGVEQSDLGLARVNCTGERKTGTRWPAPRAARAHRARTGSTRICSESTCPSPPAVTSHPTPCSRPQCTLPGRHSNPIQAEGSALRLTASAAPASVSLQAQQQQRPQRQRLPHPSPPASPRTAPPPAAPSHGRCSPLPRPHRGSAASTPPTPSQAGLDTQGAGG